MASSKLRSFVYQKKQYKNGKSNYVVSDNYISISISKSASIFIYPRKVSVLNLQIIPTNQWENYNDKGGDKNINENLIKEEISLAIIMQTLLIFLIREVHSKTTMKYEEGTTKYRIILWRVGPM